jgi:myo-inositol-1-phosphate synthase
VQGVVAYGKSGADLIGLAHPVLGGYEPGDVRFVAAFDVDSGKVGLDLSQAIFASPNCTTRYVEVGTVGVTVRVGPLLDGLAPHLLESIPIADGPTELSDVVNELKKSRAEVVVSYLPGGATAATEFYAQAALDAGAAFVNCNPELIANNPHWQAEFKARGIPLLGDDTKSQLGTTVLHRTLIELFKARGVSVDRSYQLNFGGNNDFLNMRNRARFDSKQHSKLSAIQSALGSDVSTSEMELVPPEHISFLRDHKIAYVRMEGRAFLGMKVSLEARLEVEDSPNSAGVVIDAIRAAKTALDAHLGGIIEAGCAACFKRPPTQMTEAEGHKALGELGRNRPGTISRS